MKNLSKFLSIATIVTLGLNAQTIHLERGWNNIGLIGPTSVNDFNISDSNDTIIMWKYNALEKKWYFYSNVEAYNNQIREWNRDGYNYGFITTLNAGDAVWIKSDRSIDINVGAIAYTDIKGFVKNAVTNEPINNFSVIIDGQVKTFTDTNGTFDIQNITVDSHDINITAPGFESTHIRVNIENPIPVDLGQIQLVPQQNATTNLEVRGEILNAVTGEEVNTSVRLRLFEGYNNTDGTPVLDTIVNNGRYDINVSAGSYTVLLTADGYRDTTYNYTFAPENDSDVITQNFAISPIDANVNYILRATLTWGEYPTDLDSHLIAYNPNDMNHSVWHVYWDDQYVYLKNGELYNTDYQPSEDENITKIAYLDVDDTTSFGPEHVTLYDLNTSMKYVYYVWRYSDDGELKNSNADVKVYYNGQYYDFHVPYADGRGWKVFEIDNGVLIPCQVNCMLPETMTSSEIQSWRPNDNANALLELINTATAPK